MALKLVFLLLLMGLLLFAHNVASSCNITCSTDYSDSLNCSCSDSVPTHSVLFKVMCSDGDLEVEGTCEVKPRQSWCVMYPEMLYDIAAIGTRCTATVSQQSDQVIMEDSESSSFELSNVVKLPPPFTVQVTDNDGFYNITWEHDRNEDRLKYIVRIRESNKLSEPPVHTLLVKEEKYSMLELKQLQPLTNYTVDVTVKFCSGGLYDGPWSDWSSPAEWTTIGDERVETGGALNQETSMFMGFVGPPVAGLCIVVIILICLGLFYYGKPCRNYLQTKYQMLTIIPKPNEFFKPLYIDYGGNFKDWVQGAFSEYDYLADPGFQMKCETQPDILQWSNKRQSFAQDDGNKTEGHFAHMLQPQSNSLPFLQPGSSSQGTTHSTGHISILTVTLYGEDDEVSSVNTLGSYQDGESFSSVRVDGTEQPGYDLEEPQPDAQSGVLPHHQIEIPNNLSLENLHFQLHVQPDEPERVSLDSFISNEQSEDGYPHVDLDTIDSGFGECSSPSASDSGIAEQIGSHSFPEHKNFNSNYVKQWMVCRAVQEDSENSENQLHQTQ
ncbi:uncharacterized protein V6R79_023876 [Siganus canaliculatus]